MRFCNRNSPIFKQKIRFNRPVSISKELQQQLLDTNYMLFADEDENRIYYMEIFKDYTNALETFMMDKLRQNVSDDKIAEFLDELK